MDVVEQLASEIATKAHAGQVDKAGRPYITHPERVAARLTAPADRAAAWLHDVVEDTSTTVEDLRSAGIPDPVIAAVVALTQRAGEDRDDYYRRLQADPIALRVKLADIDDNADPERLAQLDDATRGRLETKYAHAREILTESPDEASS